MNAYLKIQALLAASSLALAASLSGMATPAAAQNTAAPAAAETDNEALVERVQAALQADPYLFNKHIRVSVEKGAVVLRGYVFSDWDLRSAVRIATKAAGTTPVINNLSINAAERR